MGGMSQSADSDVIDASLADGERFGEIFERHHAAVYAYARRRLGRDEARDLAAETFVRAFRARARYDMQRDDARPWLFGIATNLIRHHWRRERRRLRAYARTGKDPVLSETDEADDRVDAERAGPELARALVGLPSLEREVLLLHVWADLSPGEIAEALGVPPGTVHSRLFRAREHMREAIAPSGKDMNRGSSTTKGSADERG